MRGEAGRDPSLSYLRAVWDRQIPYGNDNQERLICVDRLAQHIRQRQLRIPATTGIG